MNGRIESIDTIRGVAVLGILVMNVIGMAYAGAAYVNPMLTGGDDPLNIALWAFSTIVVDNKMRALFALLFGASMLLMAGSGDPDKATARHLARMGILLLFGLVHGSLLWPGDILFPLALAGILVWPFRHASVERLFFWGIMLTTVQIALVLQFAEGARTAFRLGTAAGASADAVAAWESIRAVTQSGSEAILRETNGMTGGLFAILAERHRAVLYSRLFLLPFRTLAELSGLMLIGMALYRLHWWRGAHGRRHYALLALFFIVPGLAASALCCWWFLRSDFSPIVYFLTDAASLILAPLLALGYAAVILLFVGSGACRWLVRLVAACGRMALSNYVSASVVGNILFTGIGFALFGRLSRLEVMLVVVAIWALQLGWSWPWLARFRYGPLEWLWRSLARGRMQPMRPPAYAAAKTPPIA